MKIFMLSANTAVNPYPVYPLGVGMVAAALREAGHEVHTFDFLMNDCSLELLGEAVARFEPELVGVSIRNVDNTNAANERRYIEIVEKMVAQIRGASTAPVVLGGSGFSVIPEPVLEFTGADYGIVGEGERQMCLLAESIAAGAAPPPGVLRAPQQLRHRQIPSAFYEQQILAYYLKTSRMVSVQTKRGCPKHCVYCSYPSLEGDELRARDPKEVVGDIKNLISNGANYLFFVDSLFNDSDGCYRAVVEEMLRCDVRVPWTAFFSPGGDLDEDIIAAMKKTGLHAAEVGADAATDTTLKGLAKGFSWDDVVRANELFRTNSVTTAHYYMFGGPGETRETVLEGIENVRSLRHTANFIFMGIRILPNTALQRLAVNEGVIDENNPLLDSIYYISPHVDRTWLEDALTRGFADRVDCVFPPDSLNDKLTILHKMGYTGSGYEMISG